MENHIINIYPILEFIVILFAVVGIFWTINSLTQIVLNNKKDEHIADKFLDKFPLVTSEFLHKTHKEQTVENNQEIHELYKRLEHLELYTQELNNKIDEKLNTILEEFKNRG